MESPFVFVALFSKLQVTQFRKKVFLIKYDYRSYFWDISVLMFEGS